ncbi:MAG: hypothetical protein JO287_01640 [Pseudonocardiales bacterium]|nr:hypothetical protein [Pseudonocardiales bacterium]
MLAGGADLTPALAASVRETLAEIAALRPATSLAGSPPHEGTNDQEISI